MRIDPDACRDPDLLAAEVRRLQGVIAAGEMERLSQKCDCPAPDNAARQDILTDEEREALAYFSTFCDENVVPEIWIQHAASLRGLLERTK
jgi:hypothetical protein